MLAIFKGTYLVFGETVEPRVVALTEREDSLLITGLSLCEKYPAQLPTLLRQVFKADVTELFPAWLEDTMTSLATSYEGMHWKLVRAFAAAIVLNIPFADIGKKGGKDGGSHDRLPVKPVRPRSPRG